jgi:ubiquinone/menaquinone biosynthesis C-methylase UbiE
LPSPDFGRLAASYDQLRPLDQRLVDALSDAAELTPGLRVLDIGCGTGSLVEELDRRGLRAAGVDASREMLAVARQKNPRAVLKQAGAERLPFKNGWFDRVLFVLSAHLVDRPRAFVEARRVLGPDGRLAVVTFAPEHFAGFYLNGLFPSILEIDLRRFPAPEELSETLRSAGFEPPRFTEYRRDMVQSRAEVLERIRARHISTLELVPEDEYRTGLKRAERELPDPVESTRLFLIATAAVRPIR